MLVRGPSENDPLTDHEYPGEVYTVGGCRLQLGEIEFWALI